MTSMFTIPSNILLVIGATIVLATIGFVIFGFIRGWKHIMPEYDRMKEE
jgi:hypothetical protein